MRRRSFLAVVLGVFLLAFSTQGLAEKYDLKLMTGPMGGSWYPLGGAISDAVQKAIPGVILAVAPGGGMANEEAIQFGKWELGSSNSSSALDGVHGRPPFKQEMTKMRRLANLYPSIHRWSSWWFWFLHPSDRR